ncbi:MAG: hypothetical protein JSV23_08770 [Promethearchaeota archaeon]|nr:MAG: hypothetical protein JSV23_08770 [Candidatus Lokiarchaeota archaeon]
MKKWKVILKTIGRKWFLFLIVIIIIVAIYNPIAAIWMTGITLVLFLLSYVPRLFFNNKLRNFMKKFYKIEDELIARKFKKPLQKIQDEMFELSQKQEKKNWLIIFLNKQYIFYHQETIEAYRKFYNKGYSEKEILDNLNDYKISTRAEIKAIKEYLVKLDRISEREISVKEHREKQRFA